MSNNKYKILVVEDEANIRSFVETILETNSYQVLTAASCTQGKLMFSSHNPDLVILDLGLPDMDGLDFISDIRKSIMTPIIVLSARTTEKDKISALDLGANDYVTKPFGTGELLARVRAALRTSLHSVGIGTVANGKCTIGELTIDYDRRMVIASEQEINLTQTEYNIVVMLSRHVGKVMTYNTIIQEVWGETDSGSVKKLQVNMANIRKKLGTKPGEQKFISNELGVGYRMLYDEK